MCGKKRREKVIGVQILDQIQVRRGTFVEVNLI